MPPTQSPCRVTLRCTRCLWTSALPRPCPTQAGSGRGGGSVAPLPTPRATPLGHMPTAPPPRSGRRGRGRAGGIGPRPPQALLLGRLRAASAAERLPPFHCIVPVLRPAPLRNRLLPAAGPALQPALPTVPSVLPRNQTPTCPDPRPLALCAAPAQRHVRLHAWQSVAPRHSRVPQLLSEPPSFAKPICPELPFEQWPPPCRCHTPPSNHPPAPPFGATACRLYTLFCYTAPCLHPLSALHTRVSVLAYPTHLSFPPYIRGFA